MTEKVREWVADDSEQPKKTNELAVKVMPWLFGAGIAGGHLLTASSCTIPQTGKCAVCGGCIVALGSLVSWAVINKKNGNDFYSQFDE